MEMRAVENVSIGQDLNPPLKPIAFVLHDRYLHTHCSACFSKIADNPVSSYAPNSPQNPQLAPNGDAHILYCSTRCSLLDSALHLSSAEAQLHSILRQSPPSTWAENGSSDLRLSLRLSRRLADAVGRNGKNSVFDRIDECPLREDMGCEDESFSGRIARSRSLLLGGEKRTRPHQNSGDSAGTRELERIGGLMSNRERLTIKNDGDDDDAAERIVEGAKMMAEARRLCRDDHPREFTNEDFFVNDETVLCIAMTNAVEVHDESGFTIGVAVYGSEFSWINHSCSPNACYRFLLDVNAERNSYGPRVIVRSIKSIQKGEEVTIAYTDLLQPKNMRKAELWLKYRFNCHCNRCESVPSSPVDSVLQMLVLDDPTIPEEAHEELTEILEDAISDYLQSNDPKSCTTKIESLLFSRAPKLHPSNHISINAYTALSSAYKARAIDRSLSNGDESLIAYKAGAAYSLLAALATNRLFAYEPSLIASVANSMTNAGESLLKLTCDPFLAHDFSSYISTYKCSHCSLATFEAEEVKEGRLGRCISGLASKAWSPLASENRFLGSIECPSFFLNSDFGSTKESPPPSSSLLGGDDWVKNNNVVVRLGLHCLWYGSVLSSICYGSSTEMCFYSKCLSSVRGRITLSLVDLS